jgi:hypothetical protein
VTSRADPLSNPKCHSDYRVISEVPIFVEKSFRLELLWIRVRLWIMEDGPETSQLNVQSRVNRRSTYHELAIIIDPFGAK